MPWCCMWFVICKRQSEKQGVQGCMCMVHSMFVLQQHGSGADLALQAPAQHQVRFNQCSYQCSYSNAAGSHLASSVCFACLKTLQTPC